jgi:hypothetical protein
MPLHGVSPSISSLRTERSGVRQSTLFFMSCERSEAPESGLLPGQIAAFVPIKNLVGFDAQNLTSSRSGLTRNDGLRLAIHFIIASEMKCSEAIQVIIY